MQRVKVAVTGLGVSRTYLPNYASAPECELRMVHDVNEDRARAVAEAFHVPRWTTSYEDVLASDCDMVDVSTPNQYHAEQAIAALEAGKHVLCQKPMARDVAECRAMAEASERAGRTLGVMMTWLNNPFADDLRAAIAGGCIGEVAMVRVRNAHRAPLRRGVANWRKDRANVGGGCFMQLVVHPMRLALSLTGRSVTQVQACYDNLHCRHSVGGEDVAAAVCRLDNAALMVAEASYCSTGRSVEIYGTEGQIVMQDDRIRLEFAAAFQGRRLHYVLPADGPGPFAAVDQMCIKVDDVRGDRNNAEENQNRRFIQALIAGRRAPVTAADGLHDVAVVDAANRAAESGRPVTLHEAMTCR
ncbi:MAG: Gfo/Idh/MocA family oxidoreductase [Phycisphaeraceae bacterium]